MSSACLIFALYLNQMSHLTMFLTSNLMTNRTRNETWRMGMLLFLRVLHCGFAACWYSGSCCCLFIQLSISDFFFRSFASFCSFLIRSSSLQASSWHWRSSSLSRVFLIASLLRLIKKYFMQLRIYFNVVWQVLVWFLPCTWMRWVIRRYFQQVFWWQRGRGIRRNFNILSCRVDIFFFPLHVPLRLRRLLVFRNLLLLIRTSVHFSLFLLWFWFFLCFPNLFVFSPSFFFTFKILLSFLSHIHCIIITQYVLQSFLILVYHTKRRRSLWMLIIFRVR